MIRSKELLGVHDVKESLHKESKVNIFLGG